MASKKPTKKVVKPTTKKVATKAPAKKVVTKKTNKNAGIIGIALIVLALIISVGTYAYYRTTVTGSIEGSILAWECTAGGSSNNFALNLGDLYPGKSGSWPITLSVTNFEATFTISMNTPTNVSNLVFTHTSGNTTTTLCNLGTCSGSYTETVDGTATGSASATTTINYEWPLGEPQTTNIPNTTTASSVIVNIVCTQNNKTPFTPTPAA